MAAPILSVIMGVYNCPTEEMLVRSVKSVLEQSFSDFEFIICDDGSDNGTWQWLMKLAASDSRIVLLKNDENIGLAATLNRCIKAARGEFIARQDADDYSLPARFEKQTDYLRSHEKYALVGSDCYLYEDKTFGSRKMPHHPKKKDFLFNSPYIHGSVMFRKEVFSHGLYRSCGHEGKYEDYDLFMRLCGDGINGANINEPLYAYYTPEEPKPVSAAMRFDEAAVRFGGFREMGMLPSGLIYVFKPLALAVLPHGLFRKMKRQWGRI